MRKKCSTLRDTSICEVLWSFEDFFRYFLPKGVPLEKWVDFLRKNQWGKIYSFGGKATLFDGKSTLFDEIYTRFKRKMRKKCSTLRDTSICEVLWSLEKIHFFRFFWVWKILRFFHFWPSAFSSSLTQGLQPWASATWIFF